MKNKKKIIIIIIIIAIFIFLGFGKKRENLNIIFDEYKNHTSSLNENTKYYDRIFDTSYVHLIEISISQSDWNDLQNNPTLKTKYHADVIIDGVKFENVSFNTKGNSSLQKVASGPRTERYSFKINFGKYVEDQNYFGLNKLHLNNIYADSTYLKDYITYDMFRKMNVPSPLVSYVYLKVNDKNLGLYMAIEEVDETFLNRNYLKGDLYKPEQENSESGASLKYTNDDINSYPDIFNNSETMSTIEDRNRVVSLLKQLNNMENIEDILNVDEIIRYFAVHNFVLSYDSYTGPSIHNYYLHEQDGKLSMIPWDYNMAFGAFGMKEDDEFIVNYGIDSPLYELEENDRPMWNWIYSNSEYLDKYHQYMKELINIYFVNDYFDNKVNSTYDLIKPYVSADRTAFYKPNVVNNAVLMFKDFCNLRVESINKQLSSKLSTITKNQKNNDRVNASNIDIKQMGEKTGLYNNDGKNR